MVHIALMGVYRKQFQKILAKQGLKFKLNTKVMSADKVDGKVVVKTQSAKGDKEETVSQCLTSDVRRVTSSILARSRRRVGCGRSSSLHGGS